MNKIKILTLSAFTAFTLFSFTTLPAKRSTLNVSTLSMKTTGAKATWKKDSHDFGEIPQGKPVTVEFSFTNSGDAALLITDVHTSCGCTAPDYPKEPIAAGKTSTIKVTYNANAVGAFSKTITVKTNGEEETKVLTIKGTVK
ncbi:MAG: DUF1573 domain-containing protein [Ferruginibacter sp.]